MTFQPPSDAAARKIIRAAVVAGTVSFLEHATKALEDDGLVPSDALAVLRSGSVAFDASYSGAPRYRVTGSTLIVVVELEDGVLVITAFLRPV